MTTAAEENRRRVAALRVGGDVAKAFQAKLAEKNAKRLQPRKGGKPSRFKVEL